MTNAENSKPTCCDCGREHTANYSQCPAYLNFLDSLKKKNQCPQEEIRTFKAYASLRCETISYRAETTGAFRTPLLQ